MVRQAMHRFDGLWLVDLITGENTWADRFNDWGGSFAEDFNDYFRHSETYDYQVTNGVVDWNQDTADHDVKEGFFETTIGEVLKIIVEAIVTLIVSIVAIVLSPFTGGLSLLVGAAYLLRPL